MNLDENNQSKGVNRLDEQLLKVRYAVANNIITPAQGQAAIDQIADGYAELLAYAALTSSGIKAYQPNYDLKNIFTAGAADIALACGYLNLGDFARNYYQIYNELPSQTLKK